MGIKAFFEKLFGKKEEQPTQAQPAAPHGEKENGARLVCMDCKSTFIFNSGEQQFFKMRGLTPPKRCPACRAKRKQRR